MFITERKSVPKRWRWWRRRWRQRRLQGALERSINTMLTLLAHAFSHRQCNVSSLGNKRSANSLLLSRRSMMVSKQLAWTTWPSLCASPHTMYFPIGRSCKLTLGFKGAMYLYWSNIISDWVISNPQKSRAPHLLVGVGVSFDLYSFITGRLTGEVIIIGLVSTIAVLRSCCELWWEARMRALHYLGKMSSSKFRRASHRW